MAYVAKRKIALRTCPLIKVNRKKWNRKWMIFGFFDRFGRDREINKLVVMLR
jgi:hypothetical protein